MLCELVDCVEKIEVFQVHFCISNISDSNAVTLLEGQNLKKSVAAQTDIANIMAQPFKIIVFASCVTKVLFLAKRFSKWRYHPWQILATFVGPSERCHLLL